MSAPVKTSAPTKPVERKVANSSIASYAVGLLLVAVVQSLQDGSLIAMLPPVASALLAPIVPALVVFLTGYMTTNKVDRAGVADLAAAIEVEVARQVQAAIEAWRTGGNG